MLRVSWRYSILLIAFVSFSPRVASEEQYRGDYVYNENNKAFYKFHIGEVTNERARMICDAEGATLLNATSQYDAEFVKGMFKRFPNSKAYAWIGNSTTYDHNCTVMDRDGQKTPHACVNEELPFVCKVLAINATYDAECRVYGKGYKRLPSTESCYKIPRIEYNWHQAYAECRAEGAHLVVLNSEAERAAVHTLIKSILPPEDSSHKNYYHAGMRLYEPYDTREFLTIFNQTLREAGFEEWSTGEPNNPFSECCGSIYGIDGKLNDISCYKPYSFICEKELSSKDTIENKCTSDSSDIIYHVEIEADINIIAKKIQ